MLLSELGAFDVLDSNGLATQDKDAAGAFARAIFEVNSYVLSISRLVKCLSIAGLESGVALQNIPLSLETVAGDLEQISDFLDKLWGLFTTANNLPFVCEKDYKSAAEPQRPP